MKRLAILLLLFTSLHVSAQYWAYVDSIKKGEQDCFDKGWQMASCVYEVYAQVDSLMNVVYTQLRHTMGSVDWAALQKEQQKWLIQRDAYFKQRQKAFDDSVRVGTYGQGMREILVGEKEDFIEDRFWELVPKLNTALAAAHARQADSLLKSVFINAFPGISIGIVENGKTVFTKSYGIADLNTKMTIKPEMNFNIASLTKQFTAMAVLQLEGKGKLSIDDNIGKYLPALNNHVGNIITIKNLLTHTSGLIDHYGYADSKNLKHAHNIDVFNAIKNIDSTYFAPGTRFRYSNTGFCLLALIIEKASGMGYDEYMKKSIFAPAGMLHTAVWNENENENIYYPVTGYTFDSATAKFIKSQAEEHIFFSTEGDGGIYTSVEDYMQWFKALQGGKVFSSAIVNKARNIEFTIDKSRELGYGFGWFVDAGNGALKAYHSGDNSGFRTFTFSIPSQNFLIIIFANRDDVNIEELVRKIYSIFRPGEKLFAKVEELTS